MIVSIRRRPQGGSSLAITVDFDELLQVFALEWSERDNTVAAGL